MKDVHPKDWLNLAVALGGLIWSIVDRDLAAVLGFFGWTVESAYIIGLRRNVS